MSSLKEKALKLHSDNKGKIEIVSKVPVSNSEDLTLAYTPGVAIPCMEIKENKDRVYDYTTKGNMVAVVTDGTAVLGLGDIGASASIPVMEGKSVLFKAFGGVDAFPICVNTTDIDKIVEIVTLIEPMFGGVNLEDIAAPACFEIEKRLKETLPIPVFHDDQHGTAIVVLAALYNGLKLTGKSMEELTIVINGAGAAGIAISKILLSAGVKDLIICDRRGAIHQKRTEGMNWIKEEMALQTNKHQKQADLSNALEGADVFIGVSGPETMTGEMVRLMNNRPMIFALSNPVPEIMPEIAIDAGASIVGTGRSDYYNQINNVLAFPGVLRGALDVRAKDINEEMKLAAAIAIADLIEPNELNEQYIIPKAFDSRVAPAVAKAVAKAAIDSGVARIHIDPEEVAKNTVRLVKANQ
ncbi:MAG: malic enzyme-like NAD(P)-binding protein [Bacillota bacterium]|nr:malic enzyme-like NAD(P)-binding protein [Bacillota bacterium]MDW7671037.1 malic enzyme-like NAD(P)-binding protein [Bacillota bacterium]